MATLPAVTGSDGFAPQYDPNGRWCHWNLNEIFTGGPGQGKYVPKVGDWVINTPARVTYEVSSVDPFTLLSALAPINQIGDGNDLGGDGLGNFIVYHDTSVVPYVLAIDARWTVPGTMNTYVKIFRGGDASQATGKVLSFLYDSNGNFLTNNIPLELAAIDNHDNVAIKVPVVSHTNEQLADGELVTVVAYNAQGHVTRKQQMVVENTSFIRGQGAPTKYISHISLKTNFLSQNDANVILYPLNVPLIGMNARGVIHYSNGDTLEMEIDNTKFSLLGLEPFVATVPGQRVPLTLRYKLQTDEICYGAVSADGKYAVAPYDLIADAQNGAYTVKLFGYPYFVDSATGYAMKWFMMDLLRSTMFDVTPDVSYNQNSDAFSPLLYNETQNLSVRINLRDVSGAFKSYIHTQTLAVNLREPVDANNTHWSVQFDPGQNPFYGVNLHARTQMVNSNLWNIQVHSNRANFQDWIRDVYKATKPLLDRRSQVAPPDPTHFVIFKGANRHEFPITSWNQQLTVSTAIGSSGTLFIEFIRRTAGGDLRLAVAGLPIVPLA